jgi:hypothetical protein
MRDRWAALFGDRSQAGEPAQVDLSRNGTHELTSSVPVGIQVCGYGSYTSCQDPAGLNLESIAPPPPE